MLAGMTRLSSLTVVDTQISKHATLRLLSKAVPD